MLPPSDTCPGGQIPDAVVVDMVIMIGVWLSTKEIIIITTHIMVNKAILCNENVINQLKKYQI
jgi:hypothetical protein